MEIIIVLVFVFVIGQMFFQMRGSAKLFSSITKHVDESLTLSRKEQAAKLKQQQDYNCNNCNATVKDPSNISPSGDVKCHQCDGWFNVYQ